MYSDDEIKDMFFYLHMPKCGGSSLRKFITSNISNSMYFDGNLEVEDFSKEKWSKVKFVGGHLTPDFNMFIGSDARIREFTVLRDPMARYLSHYNYYRQVLPGLIDKFKNIEKYEGYQRDVAIYQKELYERITKKSFDEFVDDELFNIETCNIYMKLLLMEKNKYISFHKPTLPELSRENLNKAIGRLNNMSFVGINEDMDGTFLLLCDLLSLPPQKSIKENITKDKLITLDTISQKTINKIKEKLDYDFIIYEYGRKLFNEKISNTSWNEVYKKYKSKITLDKDKNLNFTGERYVPNTIADNSSTGDEHWQRYISIGSLIENKVVLDIACGEGYGANYLAQKAHKVYGVDISWEAIMHAQNHYKRENLDFLAGRLEKLELDDNSIDVIVCFETIEHVTEKEQHKFLNEVKRVLRKDGMFIVSCPNKEIASDLAFQLWNYKNEYHLKEYYIAEFREFLSSYFPSVQFLHQRSEVSIILNCENAKELKIVNSENKEYNCTQNIIAICGKEKVDISALNSIVLDKRELYLQYMKTISGLTRQSEELNRIIDEKCKNNLELAHEIESFANKVKALSEENKALSEENKALNQENRKHIQVRESLQSDILAIQNSTIWRITKPIRQIIDLIKR